jgi:hypothetical protein
MAKRDQGKSATVVVKNQPIWELLLANEILRYLGSLKTVESIDRNIERVMRHLRGEKVDHVLMRQKRKS